MAAKRQEVAWAPQPGSQEAFLSSPFFETLYEGTRGPGKTDGLIMDFAQHCGQGYGAEWRGVIFRRTFPELADIIAKCRKWFAQIFPQAIYNEQKSTWRWPEGEELLLRAFERPSDYWKFHGHAYPFVGWEELTNWATDEGYLSMFSCVRSSRKGIPLKVRSTANPYGVGHNWVKRRWQLPKMRFAPILDAINVDGSPAPPRVAIFGQLKENRILLDADPDYINRIRASAKNKNQVEAWLNGSWDVTSGGMFDDLWDRRTHVIPYFPAIAIPGSWRIDRALDWGTSRPFALGWWLESSGEPIKLANNLEFGITKGDLILYNEWYGVADKPNTGLHLTETEVAHEALDREERMGLRRIKIGPADSSMWSPDDGDDSARRFARAGMRWEKSTKGPGSRKMGWQAIRDRLQAQTKRDGRPGLCVTERCTAFSELVPILPRSDFDLDDVDTEAEDHNGDMARYRVHRQKRVMRRGSW